MKDRILRFISIYFCCLPLVGSAQITGDFSSPSNLYKEGREMFLQKNYTAAAPLLKTFVEQTRTDDHLMEAEYMLACLSYEWQEKNCREQINT